MTREKAIEWLNYHINITDYEETDELYIALNMAIKALSAEPCEDCISREYILSKAHCCCDDLADDEPCCVDVDDIKNAPSVQPTAKENLVVEDCISRQEALNCLTATGLKKFDYILDARDKIKNLPPIGNRTKTDVLGKIRAEIQGMTPTYHNPDWSITNLVPISEVLKLIDKYTAESEDANG